MKRFRSQIRGPCLDDHGVLFDMAPHLEHFNVECRPYTRLDPTPPLSIEFLSKMSRIKSLEFDLNLFENPSLGNPCWTSIVLQQLWECQKLDSLTIRNVDKSDTIIEVKAALDLVDHIKSLKFTDFSWFMEKDQFEDWDGAVRIARERGVELIGPAP